MTMVCGRLLLPNGSKGQMVHTIIASIREDNAILCSKPYLLQRKEGIAIISFSCYSKCVVKVIQEVAAITVAGKAHFFNASSKGGMTCIFLDSTFSL